MDMQNFLSAISQLAEEKGLEQEKVLETVEHALASAYKKEYGKKGQIIKAKINPKTGDIEFWREKLVVDDSMVYIPENPEEDVKIKKSYLPKQEELVSGEENEIEVGKRTKYNVERHVLIEDLEEDSKLKPGEEQIIPLEKKQDFGRIAAQTAKQVVLQKIREAEKENILEEYKSKEGEIVSGIVQRIEGNNVYFDIGKSLGILPKEEQIRGEFYKEGQRLKLYVLKVDTTPKGPIIILSRAYPKLISKLFELEVPEIGSNQIEIKSIAREPGSRTKISVDSLAEGVDPIGAMVGQRGVRVAAVISELGGEKIDVIEYSDDPVKYITNALSPAKVIDVKIMPKNTGLVIVPHDQLSLAIGKEGQNVRLSSKLTGWKIDVKSDEQIKNEEEELDIDEEEDKE
ncbi:MAG TPA: transcription termination factor NusA [Candidatus Pacearchaeota archaeon]|nr:transcription termination/antitermination protein NusA [Candidatus Parcubacteria bacterium]HNP79511.1 transcription termination factor NusA [Candidatus Pacearchaeota archaeon]HOC53808.1 transcription termination factor NusA [Candidatus Pacearchaeota archaeon]HQM24712.1 transcription termination factor NusA [Candidatus Pacearchaeota archaeon]